MWARSATGSDCVLEPLRHGLLNAFALGNFGGDDGECRVMEVIDPMSDGEAHPRRLDGPLGRGDMALMIVIPESQATAIERGRRPQKRAHRFLRGIDDRAVVVMKTGFVLAVDLVPVRLQVGE